MRLERTQGMSRLAEVWRPAIYLLYREMRSRKLNNIDNSKVNYENYLHQSIR